MLPSNVVLTSDGVLLCHMSCRLIIASYSKQNVLVNRKKMPQGTKIKPEDRGFKSRMSNNIFPLKVEEGIHFKKQCLAQKIARTVSTQSLEIVAVTFKKNSKVFFDNSAQIVGFFFRQNRNAIEWFRSDESID